MKFWSYDSAVGRFTEWVIKWRWPVMIFCVVLAVVMTSGAFWFQFTADYKAYFGPDNPQLKEFEGLEKTYTNADTILFVVKPREGEIFTKKNLTEIKGLTEQAWQIPYAIRVDSLTNFQHTTADEDTLVVNDLVDDPSILSPEDILYIKNEAFSEPALKGRLISEVGKTSGILVTLQLPGKTHEKHLPDAVSAARSLASETTKKNPDLRVALTGIAVLNDALTEASKRDILTMVPVMFLIIIGSLILFFRSSLATLVTLIVITMATGSAVGLAAWGGIKITPASALAPIIILTIAIADCVHILQHVFEEMSQGSSQIKALKESLRVNAEPVFLTSLTTTIGFLSLNFSDSPPYNDLGNISAMGVVAAWVFTMLFQPAFLSVVTLRLPKKSARNFISMEWFGNFIVRKRKLMLAVIPVAALGISALAPLNVLDDRFIEWFNKNTQVRQDADFAMANLASPYSVEYSIPSGEPGGIADPAYLERLEAFTEWLKSHPRVTHVDSIISILKRLNKSMNADDPSFYRLPETRELAAQYLLVYEMSLPYGLDLNSQIDIDKSATRVIATVEALTASQIREVKRDGDQWLAENTPPSMHSKGTGTSVMFAFITERNIKSMLTGTAVAFVLIAFTLVFALKSIRLGLISLIPNILPAFVTFGFWAVFVGEIGIIASIITATSMGLVVDDTVHILSKYNRAKREHHFNTHDSIRFTFAHVGTALWVTTAVLVSGFLVLGTSSFKINSDMGILTATAVAVALVLDFLLLPPLLMAVDKEPGCRCKICRREKNKEGKP